MLDDKVERLLLFLKANQQGLEELSEYYKDPEEIEDVEEEILTKHIPADRYAKSMRDQVEWETLKNRTLTLPSGEYENPYERRVDFGSIERSSVPFNREFRELGETFQAP